MPPSSRIPDTSTSIGLSAPLGSGLLGRSAIGLTGAFTPYTRSLGRVVLHPTKSRRRHPPPAAPVALSAPVAFAIPP
jgi:hypothetical protein